MIKFNLFFAVVAVALAIASAVTDEEKAVIKESLQPVVVGCLDEFGITREQALAAKKEADINILDSCFYACIFKKIGFITDDGLYDADATIEQNKNYLKDEDDLKNLAKISKTCASVNEETVSDGNKGCERSRMLLGCLMKEKSTISYFNY